MQADEAIVEEIFQEVQRRMSNPRFIRFIDSLNDAGMYVYVTGYDERFLYKSEGFPMDVLPIVNAAPKDRRWEFAVTDKDYILIFNLPQGQMVLGQSLATVAADLNSLMVKAIVIALLVVLITSFFGYWIIRNSLKPIKDISETAERIANGNIAEQIDTSKVRSELGQLADVLNRTFGRLGEALKRQIQFTSDASHELRTPVAAILADCQFSLKRERSPERYRETIEVCHESAQHMRSLIEDLRELADFDEKNESMVAELVDMKEFLSNVVSVMKPLAEEKGLALESELEEAMVYLDPIRMRQAVLNLLSNAVRYTDSAGEIFVRCIKRANSVVIEVCDTGIGIAPDKVQHIFERFYRADAARNADTGGVGLGLAISKSIVEANGGNISVKSTLGKGTCFRIQLRSEF
ncbi:sensor histidine kinase [Rubellicoccus peritrichatus]|uniref:histidine kinase n=1 Tax=Rubellicoccus peritrichatus TaxID=3080537 RepID=A0AAQ3LCD0_9BACT|nr:ATP-binding protein [Puniceicoccus sp. CR14]WOO39439.1 ATP-binding protein [Puniceicoccus sp. CR14]